MIALVVGLCRYFLPLRLLLLFILLSSSLVFVKAQQQCLSSNVALARLGMFTTCDDISPSLCASIDDVKRACPQQCNLEYCAEFIPFDFSPPKGTPFEIEPLQIPDGSSCEDYNTKDPCDASPYCTWTFLRNGGAECVKREIPVGFNCLLTSIFECPHFPECDVVGFQCLPVQNPEIQPLVVEVIAAQSWSLGLNQPFGAPIELSTFTKVFLGYAPSPDLLPEERRDAIEDILRTGSAVLQKISHNGIEHERSWEWDSPTGGYSAYFTTETFVHADEFLDNFLESDFSMSVTLKPTLKSTTYLPDIGEDIAGRHLNFQNRFFLPPLAPIIDEDEHEEETSQSQEQNNIEDNPCSAIGLAVGSNGLVVYEVFLVEDPEDEDNNGVFTKPSIVSRLVLPMNLESTWTFVALECVNNNLSLILNSTVKWSIPTHPNNKLRIVPYVGASYYGAYHGNAHQLLFTKTGQVPTFKHYAQRYNEEVRFTDVDFTKVEAENGTVDTQHECKACAIDGAYKDFLKNIGGFTQSNLGSFHLPTPSRVLEDGRQLFILEEALPSPITTTIHVTKDVPFAIGNIMPEDLEDKWVSFSYSSNVVDEHPVVIDEKNRFCTVITAESDTFHFLFRVTFNVTAEEDGKEFEQITQQYFVSVIVNPSLQLRVRPNKRLLVSTMFVSDSYELSDYLEVDGGLPPYELSCANVKCTVRTNSEIVSIANTHANIEHENRTKEIIEIMQIINATTDHSFDGLDFVPIPGALSYLVVDGVAYEGQVVTLTLEASDIIGHRKTAKLLKFNVRPTRVEFPTVDVVVNEEFAYQLPLAQHSDRIIDAQSDSVQTDFQDDHSSVPWKSFRPLPDGSSLSDGIFTGTLTETGLHHFNFYTYTDAFNNAVFIGKFSFMVHDPLRVTTIVSSSCAPISPSFAAAFELSGEGRVPVVDCEGSLVCSMYLTVQWFGGDDINHIVAHTTEDVEVTANVIVSYPGYKCYLSSATFPSPNMRSLITLEYSTIAGDTVFENVTVVETFVETVTAEESTEVLTKDVKTGIAVLVVLLVVIVVAILFYRWSQRNGEDKFFSQFGLDFTNALKRPPEYSVNFFTKMHFLPLVHTSQAHTRAFKGIFKDKQTLFCTILKMESTASHVQRKRFYNAAAILHTMRNHEHVIQVYGVVGDMNKPMYMLVDFTGTMSLDILLESQSEVYNLPLNERLSILNQVARGLKHVHEQGFAHRNICARSILYDMRSGECKLFGFEYAKYYKKNDSLPVEHTVSLDIRWCALEVLRDNVFSFESDVWSFGVFMYEVFTEGSKPYDDLEQDSDVMDLLVRGNRLPNPINGDDKIHNCMLRCWMAAERSRPSLRSLIKCFTTVEEITRIELAKNSLTGDTALFSRIPTLDLMKPLRKGLLRRNSASSLDILTSPAMRSVLVGDMHSSDSYETNDTNGEEGTARQPLPRRSSNTDYWGEMYDMNEDAEPTQPRKSIAETAFDNNSHSGITVSSTTGSSVALMSGVV
eukprot:m.227162 g.227162  ORF g.227162 m.227162 type:complete len:1494 (+) comp13867_c0_seq25:212-4693(+)